MILRFDEVLSDKVNKSWIKTFEKDLISKFESKSVVE